jgi:hypothetical protein
MVSSDDSLSALTEKYWTKLLGDICKMKKLTSQPFNNTNREMLSKSSFGNRRSSYLLIGTPNNQTAKADS